MQRDGNARGKRPPTGHALVVDQSVRSIGAGSAKQCVEGHGDAWRGAEDQVGKREKGGVANRIMGRVGARSIGPKPRVARAGCEATRQEVVVVAVFDRGKAGVGKDYERHPREKSEGKNAERVRRARGDGQSHPSGWGRRHPQPSPRMATTTSHSGSPTTPV